MFGFKHASNIQQEFIPNYDLSITQTLYESAFNPLNIHINIHLPGGLWLGYAGSGTA